LLTFSSCTEAQSALFSWRRRLCRENIDAMPKARSRVTQAQYEVLARFRYSLRRFLSFSEQAARGAGITPQRHQALLAIKGFAGGEIITIGELAESLQIRHHSAVGLVDRLIAEGYARRVPAKDDRRRVRLVLSPRGEAILEELTHAHLAQLHGLSPEINRLLGRFLGAADAPAEPNGSRHGSRRRPASRGN